MSAALAVLISGFGNRIVL